MRVRKSESHYEKASKIIPWGTQTEAKRAVDTLRGVMPLYINEGRGCRIYDIDGNEFIDYRCSLGPIILGYAYPRVNKAVIEQLGKGNIFSMASPLEYDLARELINVIPCAEMVRFLKTGGDATSAAIRIARAYTKREKIISCGYHGWHDWWAAKQEGIEQGVPNILRDYILDLPYNDSARAEDIVKKYKDDIAAIITIPYDWVSTPNADNWLQNLRNLASAHGILLIFDEILTGFRLALGGGQEYFRVTPDLAVFGKGMANGFPISAFVGKREFMKKVEELYITATHAGDVISVVAAIVTIKEIKEKRVIEHIWRMGKKLMDGLNQLVQEFGIEAKCSGLPPILHLEFEDKKMDNIFTREMLQNGIFLSPDMLILSFSHKEEDINKTLETTHSVLKRITK